MRVEPDQRELPLARGQALDRADVRAAATAEHERPLRQVGRERKRLLLERFRFDDRGFGIRQLQPRRLGHRLAAVAPRLRNAHKPRREIPAAGVALVIGPERNGRERLAVGTLGAQAAHVNCFS